MKDISADMARKIVAWRRDPVFFVRDQFGVEPDPWQRELLEAFPDPEKRHIAMQACAGPGKTAGLAWCGWNFLSCYAEPGEHPKGAAISCTSDNLRDNLWPEMAKWQERSDFLNAKFKWMKKKIECKDAPNTWFLSARSYSKSATPDEQGRSLSGLHSKFIIYLIDESGDINPAVLRSAEQGLSTVGGFKKILQAGNPTSHQGMLYLAATKQANKWMIIRITGDPDDPRRSPRIDKAHSQEQIDEWGRDNPWVMAYILGLFPPSSINSLFSPDEVEDAMAQHLREHDYAYSQKRLGIDVARFGDDRTVIAPRQGLAAFPCVTMRNARTPEIVARVIKAKFDWGSEVEFVDGTGGWGAGVVDGLHQGGYNPIEVLFNEKAFDPRYYNKRAEMYFNFSKWVKRGGALPKSTTLKRELTEMTYTYKDSKLIMESKEQIKKRLGFSPDEGDGYALTFAHEDAPAKTLADQIAGKMQQQQKPRDWDPYADDRV